MSNATQDIVAPAAVAPVVNAAKTEMENFRNGAAYLSSLTKDKRKALVLKLAAVIAGELFKENRTLYADKAKQLRKDTGKDAKESPEYLEKMADIDFAVAVETVKDVADGLADSVDALVAEVPSVTAALRLTLNNPRQTIADGVKRIDFACRHLNLTADSRKAIGLRVDAISSRWAAEKTVDSVE